MNLGSMIAAYRKLNRYGVREMAKIIGVSSATLNRVERGEYCDARTLIKIMAWLFAEPAKEAVP